MSTRQSQAPIASALARTACARAANRRNPASTYLSASPAPATTRQDRQRDLLSAASFRGTPRERPDRSVPHLRRALAYIGDICITGAIDVGLLVVPSIVADGHTAFVIDDCGFVKPPPLDRQMIFGVNTETSHAALLSCWAMTCCRSRKAKMTASWRAGVRITGSLTASYVRVQRDRDHPNDRTDLAP